jgi:hypothetical protein
LNIRPRRSIRKNRRLVSTPLLPSAALSGRSSMAPLIGVVCGAAIFIECLSCAP